MRYDWIPQSSIETRWDCNPRERDEDHIRAIATHMDRDGYDKAFPVVIYDITDRSKLTNNLRYMASTGHHRIAASLLEDNEFPNLPLNNVYCEIRKGTYQECYRYMLIDNFLHTPGFNKSVGKMPTRDELRKMRSQLLLFPDVFAKGDRLLAKEWGCHRDTVSKIRDEVIEKIQVDEIRPPAQVFGSFDEMKKLKEIIKADLYVGLDGKKYPRAKTEVIVPAEDVAEIESEGIEAQLAQSTADLSPEVEQAIREDLEEERAKREGDINAPILLYDGIARKHKVDTSIVATIAQEVPQETAPGKPALSAAEREKRSMQKKASSAPTNLDQWKDMIKEQIKTWKKKHDGCGYASLTMFLHATLKYHSLPHTTEITEEIYEKLMNLLTTKRTGILEVLVKRQLRGESLWKDDSDGTEQDTKEENDCIIGFIQVNANLQNFVFTENSEDVDKYFDCYALSDLPAAVVDEISRVVKGLEAERSKVFEKKEDKNENTDDSTE